MCQVSLCFQLLPRNISDSRVHFWVETDPWAEVPSRFTVGYRFRLLLIGCMQIDFADVKWGPIHTPNDLGRWILFIAAGLAWECVQLWKYYLFSWVLDGLVEVEERLLPRRKLILGINLRFNFIHINIITHTYRHQSSPSQLHQLGQLAQFWHLLHPRVIIALSLLLILILSLHRTHIHLPRSADAIGVFVHHFAPVSHPTNTTSHSE
jgi:hypothetical protein